MTYVQQNGIVDSSVLPLQGADDHLMTPPMQMVYVNGLMSVASLTKNGTR